LSLDPLTTSIIAFNILGGLSPNGISLRRFKTVNQQSQNINI
jgi:hypothetical protein